MTRLSDLFTEPPYYNTSDATAVAAGGGGSGGNSGGTGGSGLVIIRWLI